MSLFGGADSGPSNADIMADVDKNFKKLFQAMDAGFQGMMGAVDAIGTKVDDIAEQMVLVQSKLDELLELTGKIYSSTVLQGRRIKTFTQRVVELN